MPTRNCKYHFQNSLASCLPPTAAATSDEAKFPKDMQKDRPGSLKWRPLKAVENKSSSTKAVEAESKPAHCKLSVEIALLE